MLPFLAATLLSSLVGGAAIPNHSISRRDPILPVTVGRMLLTFKSGKWNKCTGTVVGGPGNNIVVTAGHCVYESAEEGLPESVQFEPAYWDNRPARGTWSAASTHVTNDYMSGWSVFNDQAFLKMNPLDGKNIADDVSSYFAPHVNGVGPGTPGNGTPPDSLDVVVWGYPAAYEDLDHKVAVECWGTATRDSDGTYILPDCRFGGGMSGGPWFLGEPNTNGSGAVMGVTTGEDGKGGLRLSVFTQEFLDAVNTV